MAHIICLIELAKYFKFIFRLYQLEVELIDVQDEMVKTKYWLNTNRKRYNDNADKKQTKKRR